MLGAAFPTAGTEGPGTRPAICSPGRMGHVRTLGACMRPHSRLGLLRAATATDQVVTHVKGFHLQGWGHSLED